MIIASIDIGTNTALLLIAAVEKNGKITVLKDMQRIPRIGKGLTLEGKISDEKIEELFKVLAEYEMEIKQYRCEEVIVTATNALRTGKNGEEIAEMIRGKYDWGVNIIQGDEEGELAFLGVSEYTERGSWMVIDIGGGSSEIVIAENNEAIFKESFHYGAVSMREQYFDSFPVLEQNINKLWEHIANATVIEKSLLKEISGGVAIAGTPTTLAIMKRGLTRFDEGAIEGDILTKDEVLDFIRLFAKMTPEQILARYGEVVKYREDLILAGSCILYKIMSIAGLDKVKVSTKGIRFGAIIKEIIKGRYF